MQIRVRSGRRRKYTHAGVILELRLETRAARLKAFQPQPRSNFPDPVHITLRQRLSHGTLSLRVVLLPAVLLPAVSMQCLSMQVVSNPDVPSWTLLQ